jgi:hypothetical protein
MQTHTLLSESRSLFGRMKILRDKEWCVEIGAPWVSLPNGHLVENRSFLARTAGIQKLLSSHPQASQGDLEIFLLGWGYGRNILYCGGPQRGFLQSIVAAQYPKAINYLL